MESATTAAAAVVPMARRHGKGAAACQVPGCAEALAQLQNKVRPVFRPGMEFPWRETASKPHRAAAAAEVPQRQTADRTPPCFRPPAQQAHRICSVHRASPTIATPGGRMRFCQQEGEAGMLTRGEVLVRIMIACVA